MSSRPSVVRNWHPVAKTLVRHIELAGRARGSETIYERQPERSMEFVVKIKFKNTLRRLTVERGKDGSLGLTFNDLVAKICDMFQISLDERLVLTYTDQDNDFVTMCDDLDLYDAWIIQKINPLRIHVNVDDLRIQEVKEALNKLTLSNGAAMSHENVVHLSSSHLANRKREQVKSTMGNWRSEETLSQGVQDVRKLYRADDSTQKFLQTSYRRENPYCGYSIGGKAQRNSPLHVWKHHHRRKKFPEGASMTGKLDARFVCDVTIFDGTELACGTHFTKIWRLRNIGTCPWPRATLLVCTGGDFLGTKQSALVEVPQEGLPCEEEMNIAVDFVAPECPGRYVSHWRLQASSGQKFGQRIWVLIKAISKCMDDCIPHTIKEITSHQESVERDFNNDMPTMQPVSQDAQKSWAHQ